MAFRVAGDPVATNNGLFFIYGDHLGSTTMLGTSGGAFVAGSLTRYRPFGSYRTAPTQTITDRDFTGQRENRELGLLYYNARFYHPGIGRFLSADTLIPNPADPQGLNRYSYVNNNALRYNDPTGHWLETVWDVANVVMGVTSLADNVSQGNYGWAAVDAVGLVVDAAAAVVPVIPGGVGTAIKAYRAADKVEDAVSAAVRYGDNAVKAADEVVAMADEAVEVVTDCINSFSAETVVVTAAGAVPIAEIEVGEWVLGYNEFSGDIAYYSVTHLISHVDEEVVTLTIAGERLVTTAEHPFYTSEGNWVEAGDLQPGDRIRTAAWATGTVEAVTTTTDPQPMYNFTVATAHTYFVGDGEWLVHNACPLRNNIGAQAGEQAHHLIPNQSQGHDFVQRATKGGWEQHAAYNGMALPDNPAAAVAGPYHNGSHSNYTTRVTGYLNDLEGQAVRQNWSDKKAFQELQNLAQQMRQSIRNMPAGARVD